MSQVKKITRCISMTNFCQKALLSFHTVPWKHTHVTCRCLECSQLLCCTAICFSTGYLSTYAWKWNVNNEWKCTLSESFYSRKRKQGLNRFTLTRFSGKQRYIIVKMYQRSHGVRWTCTNHEKRVYKLIIVTKDFDIGITRTRNEYV